MIGLDASPDRKAAWTDGAADVPAEGENVTAQARGPGDGPVYPGFREIANRVDYVRAPAEQALGGSLLDRARLVTTYDELALEPLGTVALWKSANEVIYADVPRLVLPAAALAINRTYSIYLYWDAASGSVQLEAAVSPFGAPDNVGNVKTTDKTRRFVGTAYTCNAFPGTKWIPGSQSGRHWMLDNGLQVGAVSSRFVGVSMHAGTSAWATLNLRLSVPFPDLKPVAVDLWCSAHRDGAAGGVFFFNDTATTETYNEVIAWPLREGYDLVTEAIPVPVGAVPRLVDLPGAQVGDKVRRVRRLVNAAGVGLLGKAGDDISTKFESVITVNDKIQYVKDDLLTDRETLNGEMTLFSLTRLGREYKSAPVTVPLIASTNTVGYYADSGITIDSLVVTGYHF